MLKQERTQQILALLSQRGSMTVEELGRELYVSAPTMRRDLNEMQRAGMLIRTHGGALPLSDGQIEMPIRMRNTLHLPEKLRLARAAARLVHPGNVLFIDASSTVLHIIDHLTACEGLTVITNSLQAMLLLQKYDIRTYCTGGRMIGQSLALAGSAAERMVEDFNIDLLFFSSRGVNEQGWIVDYGEEETELRRRLIRQSARKVFLCDSSKFGVNCTYNVARLSDVDDIITDAPLPREYQTGRAHCMVV